MKSVMSLMLTLKMNLKLQKMSMKTIQIRPTVGARDKVWMTY